MQSHNQSFILQSHISFWSFLNTVQKWKINLKHKSNLKPEHSTTMLQQTKWIIYTKWFQDCLLQEYLKKKKNLFCFDFFLKKKNLDTSYKEKNSQI